jgi:hypothetical protein
MNEDPSDGRDERATDEMNAVALVRSSGQSAQTPASTDHCPRETALDWRPPPGPEHGRTREQQAPQHFELE